jgi:diguanylate cyclase (GGDEF)-like protein
MDMDGFKQVNDTGGHAAGDAVLREVAAVFRSWVRERDTLARLGGDEFGLILEHCPQSQALGAAYQLRKAIQDHEFQWEGRGYRVGVSIGFVPISGTNWTLAELLAAADSACYEAKRIGRSHIQPTHKPTLKQSPRSGESRWSQNLTEALTQERFWLHCQPIAALNAECSEPSCYEILVRMIDTDGNLIEPCTFVPVAERLGIMPQIDRWVIRNAFSTVLRGSKHRSCPRYSINLSGTSLNDTGLLGFIREQLQTCEVNPGAVCFEITETAVIHNLARTAHLMRELKGLDCSFALDDFGSGLSSFGYLKALPVDYLKIDGSFVRNMEEDSVDYAMVKCINEIGHVMGIKTVAEFVHSKALWDKLKSLRVDYAQGDVVGAPRPLHATD